MILKIIYTIFLGILIALFVGLGIDAFYTGPQPPEYPSKLAIMNPECDNYDAMVLEQEKYDQMQKEFSQENKIYNRNVSIVSLIAAIIVMIISLTFLNKIAIIADGLLLGSVFTTVYSISRGLMSEDATFRFLVVTIGLILALVLGYIKFIRPKEMSEI